MIYRIIAVRNDDQPVFNFRNVLFRVAGGVVFGAGNTVFRRSSLATKEPATTRQASRVKREYEEVPLPSGKIKLGNIYKTYPICFENGTALLELDSLERRFGKAGT